MTKDEKCIACEENNPMHCVDNKCSLTFTEKCEECQQGYFIDDGNCLNCTENGCADMECNTVTGECTDCPEPYYLENVLNVMKNMK